MPVSGSAIGSTPFGMSTPTAAPLPATEGPALAKYINPGTGDYELNSTTGQFKKMPPLKQRVLLIALTIYGSSTASPTLGIRRPPKMDETFEYRIRNAVRIAYQRLTDTEKVMRIDDIFIERRPSGRAIVTLSFTDLTIGVQQSVPFLV